MRWERIRGEAAATGRPACSQRRQELPCGAQVQRQLAQAAPHSSTAGRCTSPPARAQPAGTQPHAPGRGRAGAGGGGQPHLSAVLCSQWATRPMVESVLTFSSYTRRCSSSLRRCMIMKSGAKRPDFDMVPAARRPPHGAAPARGAVPPAPCALAPRPFAPPLPRADRLPATPNGLRIS